MARSFPPPANPPDEQPGTGSPGPDMTALLRRCARGDQEAFAALYDASAPRLYGLAVRIVRNPGLAEDVVQEAFLDLWRHSARFDPAQGSALSWMLTITHRKAVDRVRSMEASSRRDSTYEQRSRQTAFDSTAETAHAGLEGARVRRSLDSLTATQREAVELAYFGGYTHTEIARLLDLPLGTAKTRIRDGLIRLRDTMGVE